MKSLLKRICEISCTCYFQLPLLEKDLMGAGFIRQANTGTDTTNWLLETDDGCIIYATYKEPMTAMGIEVAFEMSTKELAGE